MEDDPQRAQDLAGAERLLAALLAVCVAALLLLKKKLALLYCKRGEAVNCKQAQASKN